MNKESVHKIASHYGYEVQSRQCIEEMAELTQAINKYWRSNSETYNDIKRKVQLKDNLIEKIADVEIMLWQLEYLLNVDVEPIIEQKISKQLERIEKE